MPLLQKQGHFRAEKMGMKNNPRFSAEGQIEGRFVQAFADVVQKRYKSSAKKTLRSERHDFVR